MCTNVHNVSSRRVQYSYLECIVVTAVHPEDTLYNKLPYQTYTMNMCYHEKKGGGGNMHTQKHTK